MGQIVSKSGSSITLTEKEQQSFSGVAAADFKEQQLQDHNNDKNHASTQARTTKVEPNIPTKMEGHSDSDSDVEIIEILEHGSVPDDVVPPPQLGSVFVTTCQDMLDGKLCCSKAKTESEGVSEDHEIDGDILSTGKSEAVDPGTGSDSDNGVTISIAPPEKWQEKIEDSSDDDMEDGEISCSDEESDTDNLDISCLPWPEKAEKRCPTQDGYEQEQLLKRRKLEVFNNPGNDFNDLTTFVPFQPNGAGYGERNPGTNKCGQHYNSPKSSSSLANKNSNQFISRQQYTRQQGLLKTSDRCVGTRGEEEPSDSLLLPLFKEVIDAERKKKAELEDENKNLKSLLAKMSVEKEETFNLLRKSNKKLSEVTDASIGLGKKVEELRAQLAERNAMISNLRKDTAYVRGVISRMTRRFESKEVSSRPSVHKVDDNRGERRNASASRSSVSRMRTHVSEDCKSEETTPPSLMTLETSPSSDDKQKRKKESESSSPLEKYDISCDEEFIMTKLKDLTKWAFTLKDIKKIDGKWRCPECGDTKYTMLATAAHARDKHVWKLGAGFKPRYR